MSGDHPNEKVNVEEKIKQGSKHYVYKHSVCERLDEHCSLWCCHSDSDMWWVHKTIPSKLKHQNSKYSGHDWCWCHICCRYNSILIIPNWGCNPLWVYGYVLQFTKKTKQNILNMPLSEMSLWHFIGKWDLLRSLCIGLFLFSSVTVYSDYTE